MGKLSRSDLKPAVKIKMAAAPEPALARRKKKQEDEPVDDPFAGVPEAKPKVKDEFKEKDKKPKEEEKIVITPAVLKPEEESSEEEEEKPVPKKKLSRSDLKPAVQIKMAAAPQPALPRRKKKQDDEPQESLFDNLPQVKPKVRDEFTDKDKKPKEEEKIVIEPAVLPTKPAEKPKVKDEFAERE